MKPVWSTWTRTFFLGLDRERVPDQDTARSFAKAGRLPRLVYRMPTLADLEAVKELAKAMPEERFMILLGPMVASQCLGDWSLAGMSAQNIGDLPEDPDQCRAWFRRWPIAELDRFYRHTQAEMNPSEELEGNSEAP